MRKDNPYVRECPRRSGACHSSCPDYKTYRETIDHENKLRRDDQLKDELSIIRTYRAKKRLRRERKKKCDQ